MGKLVDAEITLKYSNGQLTIASTPNTIKGDGLLSYLDLAECAIIGANYKNLNEAMDIACRTRIRDHCNRHAHRRQRKDQPEDGGHRPRRAGFALLSAMRHSEAGCACIQRQVLCQRGQFVRSVSITPMATLGRKSFPTGSSFSFGLLAHLATTPTGRPSTSDILSIAPPQHGGRIKTRHRSRQTPTRRAKAGRKDFPPWKA